MLRWTPGIEAMRTANGATAQYGSQMIRQPLPSTLQPVSHSFTADYFQARRRRALDVGDALQKFLDREVFLVDHRLSPSQDVLFSGEAN